MFAHSAFKRGDNLFMLQDAWSICDSPLPGVHQPVVTLVERFIHPFIFTDVNVNGQVQFRALVDDGIHKRIINMNAEFVGGCAQPSAFVAQLTNADRPRFVAAFEFSHCRLTESGLAQASKINAAPHSESFRILAVPLDSRIKFRAGTAGENDYPLDADLIHGLHPASDFRIRANIIMRMDINHRVTGLFDARFRDLENRFRLIIFEKYLIGSSLSWARYYERDKRNSNQLKNSRDWKKGRLHARKSIPAIRQKSRGNCSRTARLESHPGACQKVAGGHSSVSGMTTGTSAEDAPHPEGCQTPHDETWLP